MILLFLTHILTFDQYLKENMGASAVKLTPEDIAAIRKIAEESEIPGDRYPEIMLAHVLVHTPPLPN